MSTPELRRKPLYCIGQNGQQCDEFTYRTDSDKQKLLRKFAVLASKIYSKPPAPPEQITELKTRIKELRREKWMLMGECKVYLKMAPKLDEKSIAEKFPHLKERAARLAQIFETPYSYDDGD